MTPQITTDLSSVQIWDNLLDDRFILELDEESNVWNWQLNNIANRNTYPYGYKGSHLFFGCTLFFKEPNGFISNNNCPENIYNLYLYLLQNLIQDSFNLVAIHANAQSMGQVGTPHLDHFGGKNAYSLMLFLNSKWEESWGGKFQFLESLDPASKVVKSISPKPGRIVLFKGDIPHQGLAPIKPYIVRKTLVYRLVKNE